MFNIFIWRLNLADHNINAGNSRIVIFFFCSLWLRSAINRLLLSSEYLFPCCTRIRACSSFFLDSFTPQFLYLIWLCIFTVGRSRMCTSLHFKTPFHLICGIFVATVLIPGLWEVRVIIQLQAGASCSPSVKKPLSLSPSIINTANLVIIQLERMEVRLLVNHWVTCPLGSASMDCLLPLLLSIRSNNPGW